MRGLTPITWLLLAVLLLATAGIVHIGSVLALPWRSRDDAFARVASITPLVSRTLLPPPAAAGTPPDQAGDRLPLRDPAMLTAVCRFDLDALPFRLSTSPFADGFVTVGFHGRHGTAFYGLTVQARDASSLDLVVRTTPETRDAGAEDPPGHQVTVLAPEPAGFVMLSTPLGEASERGDAEDRLRHFVCLSQPAP